MSPADAQNWTRLLAPITDAWVKGTPDGARVLAAYRAEVAKATKEQAR
jgi:hypothetical protein